jgi:hypothetical protein
MLLLLWKNKPALTGTSPTVDAGGPYTAEKDVATVLDATIVLGTDPSPTLLWTIVSGGTGTFSDDSIEDPTFTPDNNGGYVLRLTVTPSDAEEVFDIALLNAVSSGDYIRHWGRRRKH